MQAMGAYGFRGYIERKPLFLQSLPLAIRILSWLSDHHPLPLKLHSLPHIFKQLIDLQTIREYEIREDALKVSIHSFSYKKGIPHDTSLRGGGFVFDCRTLENPGHLEEYMAMNGKDQAIAEFLESKSVVMEFFMHSLHMVEQALTHYQKAGKGSLMVSYGCTGGQHRSVFMAERLAAYLKIKFAIQLVVLHHELEKEHEA
jgi:RNase adaptor protein for sRNA GlmZ degradation